MSLMDMVGKLVCAWKAKHVWRRVTQKVGEFGGKPSATEKFSQCARCGATRPIKPRTRKANVAIAEGGGNG